jgi:EmrB/QacA subfamily drug resistance transporter
MASRTSGPGAVGTGTGTAADSSRWWILALVCLATLMVTLDVTVMNLAMPSAQEELEFTNADRQWIVTAYALSFGSLLLFCGRLADLVGRKLIVLIGLGGFAVASAAGGASVNFAMLVTARACQGVFAAMLAPALLSLLATTFTNPKDRGKAFSVFGAIAASGSAVGLILGGALTSVSWRWCLYVNLIFAAVAIAGGVLLLGKQARIPGARLDVLGAVTVSGGMFGLVYGFSNAATHSWGTTSTWGPLAVGGVLLVVFAVWQSRAVQPLLPPRVVLDRNRGGAYLASLIIGVGTFGILLFLTFYMQVTLGYSVIVSGVALLPMVVLTAVGANVGNIKLMPRTGPKPLIIAGMLLNAAGMAWLTGISVDSGYATALLGPLLVIGFGIGLLFSASFTTGTSGVAPHEAGVASACISAGQQLGGAIGVALLNTIATSATASYLTGNVDGRSTRELVQLAEIHSYQTVFWWCVGIFTVGAIVCGALMRRGPLPGSAHPAAEGQAGAKQPDSPRQGG